MMQTNKFKEVVSQVTKIGQNWHSDDLLKNVEANSQFIEKGFKDLPALSAQKKESSVIISAGPSLHKYKVIDKLIETNYQGTIVAVDGSLIHCLKKGLIPDYVVTLDPHPTRIVRWFGDKDFEKNSFNDDYFSRQDLDVDFRNNSILENQKNIDLINKYAPSIKLIICSSAPKNVVERAIEAKFDMYWWNPIVDKPQEPESLTRRIFQTNKKSCMNTGGTVGTAAWVFANAILDVSNIALTGMDLGYHQETPLEMTQTYYELHEFVESKEQLEELFPKFTFPLTGEEFYTDPTYYWYRGNFLELLTQATGNTVNCSEAGTLYASNLPCTHLNSFLKKYK